MRFYTLLVVSILFIQCSQKEKKTSAIKGENHHAITAIDTSGWQGVYQGTVPSKTCVGMDMNLSLNPSNTYELNITFLQKNPIDNQTARYKGNIEWAKDSATIILKELDTISNKFRVRKNVVEYLNPDATPNTGQLSEFYILKRQSH